MIRHTFTLLNLLATATALMANPFTARFIPADLDGRVTVGYAGKVYGPLPISADFRGNGKQQWYAGGNVISFFPENGFITLPSYTLPQWPSATIQPLAGIPIDIDGDGDQDIVRLNSWNGMDGHYTLAVFVNNGSGSFTVGWRMYYQHTPKFNAGNERYQLLGSDFNGDGYQDIAILLTYKNANSTVNPPRAEGSLLIRWNDRTGKFSNTTTLQSTGFDDSASMCAEDFDNDGDIDLICNPQLIYSSDGLVFTPRYFENNGKGVFHGMDGPNNSMVSPSQAVDLNDDGWIDYANDIYYALNSKDGIMGHFNIPTQWESPGRGKAWAFADFNNDGLADLIYGNDEKLMLKTRTSSMYLDDPIIIATFNKKIISIGVSDSDSDGDIDTLVILEDGRFVFVENQAHHWAPGITMKSNSGASYELSGISQLESVDFNQDGLDDLLAVTPSQKKLWVLYGSMDGVPTTPLFKNTQNTSPGAATISDLDNDGRPDIAYTLPSSGTVRWARNSNSSPFTWLDTQIASELTGVNLITTGQHGSPNGRDELLIASHQTGMLRWLYRIGETWNGQSLLNSNSVKPFAILAHNFSAKPGNEPCYLGYRSASETALLHVRGYQLNGPWESLGEFSEPTLSIPSTATLAQGDINGDGKDDLVFMRGNGNVVYWTPGSAFALQIGATPSPIRALRVVDWNRDGRPDVLCATATGLSLFYWNNSWKHEELYSHAGGFEHLCILNINRDGFPDLAASNLTHLYFFSNTPRALHVSNQSPISVSLIPDKEGTAMTLNAAHHGRSYQVGTTWLSDVGTAATGAFIQLHRAVNNGQWTKGASLTRAELNSIAHGFSLLADGAVVGSSGPQLLEENGTLHIKYNPVLGNLVPISGGATQPLQIRINLRADAAQSSLKRFFITLNAIQARVLDGTNLDHTVFPATNTEMSVLVNIMPNYTPLQQWRINHFGQPDPTGPYSNEADYDGDGVPNLVEYFLGTNPKSDDFFKGSLLTILPLINPTASVKFRFIANYNAFYDSKIKLIIEQSFNGKTWTTLASRVGGGAWSGLAPDSTEDANYYSATCTFTTSYTPKSTPQLMLRMRVEELP